MKRLLPLVVAGLFGVSLSAPFAGAQGGPGVAGASAKFEALLEGARGRVRGYQARLFSVRFTETVRRQDLRSDGTAKGKEREFVYESLALRRELRDGREAPPVLTRQLKSVDGKPAPAGNGVRQEQAPRSKCGYSPEPPRAYSDALSFLLPEFQGDYVFSDGGEADYEGRKVAVISVAQPPTDPPTLKFEGDCFYFSRAPRREGRVLVDPQTFDVLQVSWRLAETFRAKSDTRVVRRGLLLVPSPAREFGYERLDSTTTFRPVAFADPKETLLLPVSSESVRLLKGASHPGARTAESYTNYKRYRVSVEVKETDDADQPPPPPALR